MSRTGKKLLARRKRLFAEHPFCHWCNKKLTDVPLPSGRLPRNFATIDHLVSKNGPRYDQTKTNQTRRTLVPLTVLACRVCNFRRNSEELARMAGSKGAA